MLKKIVDKIKQKRLEREKSKYMFLECRLRSQGIKHIRYTKYGVPYPDWDKILAENWQKYELKGEGQNNDKCC